jgi:ribosomal-protein-alanine N-acetyltransferase
MSAFESETFSIRAMTAGDLASVVDLERRCHVNPWSKQLFEEELSRHQSAVDLLWQSERLVGYICYWRICDELHILNVAVDPAFRRRGLGRLLLSHALKCGCARGCERAILEVRAGNSGAISLYQAFDFTLIGRRTRYYPDGEDALVMERKIARD